MKERCALDIFPAAAMLWTMSKKYSPVLTRLLSVELELQSGY